METSVIRGGSVPVSTIVRKSVTHRFFRNILTQKLWKVTYRVKIQSSSWGSMARDPSRSLHLQHLLFWRSVIIYPRSMPDTDTQFCLFGVVVLYLHNKSLRAIKFKQIESGNDFEKLSKQQYFR